VIPGQAYDVSMWAKATPETGGCYVYIALNGARPDNVRTLTLNGEYQQFTYTYPGTFFKKAANTFTAVVRCGQGVGGGKVTFDDMSMTQVV
jgi:hypothetical protein